MNEARPPSIFAARLRFWLLTGALLGVAVAVLGVLVLTQTRWGHERVLEFTLRTAAERLNGTLEIQRLEGNLLGGARVYGLSLRGPNDDAFLSADSAYLEYSLRTIAGEEIVLDRVVLFNAELHLWQMPGDTLWNYDRIFGDTIPPEVPPEPRGVIVVRSASLHDSRIFVELPWEPDPELPAVERQREIEAALADTAAIFVRPVPGGYLRTFQFLGVDADLARVVSAPDELGGTSLHVAGFAGDIHLYRRPLRIEAAEGDLAYAEALLRFQLGRVLLPESRLSGFGTIRFGREDGPALDIQLRGDTVAFTDLHWLQPTLPAAGGGALELLIETRPEGTLFLARDLRLAAPGTRLRGSFGLLAGEELRFVDVDLEADPLRVSTVEQMLPTDLPVVGLQIGGVEIRQPAS